MESSDGFTDNIVVSQLDEFLFITPHNTVTVNDSITTQNNPSMDTDLQTVAHNTSHPSGCRKVVYSEMEFLPWDNPDNIVSAEAEAFAYRLKCIVLVLLFLIGGPGNVINMAVFCKQGLKDRVNLCLFALSLADELYLIAAMFHHAELVHTQFSSTDRYGPMFTFLANNNFAGFLGLMYVSMVLSAIIASERCLCVLSPLNFHTLIRTRTMAVVIVFVYLLAAGPYFIVSLRMHIGCVYDPSTGFVSQVADIGAFYKTHKALVDRLDSFVYGVGLPGVVMVVVVTATIITVVKLRQVVTWRTETSSSISPREVALTKMLIGTSILFIICVFPFAVSRFSWLFLPEMNSGRRNHNLYLTTFWMNKMMTYFNASFNILVYYAMGSRYRDVFWALFSRRSKPGQK